MKLEKIKQVNAFESIRQNYSNGNTYIWNKNWVRPYESLFSVMRNFCKVNALTGSMALKKLGCRKQYIVAYASSFFEGRLSGVGSIEERENLWNALLPKWHIRQIRWTEFSNGVGEYIVAKKIQYCPECVKENYHSIFHNIEGIEECPIHHIRLAIENRPPNPALLYYNAEDNDTSVLNARNGVLPYDRHVNPSIYQFVKFRKCLSIEPIVSRSRSVTNAADLILDSVKPSFILQIEKKELSYENLKRDVIKWFNDKKILRSYYYPYDPFDSVFFLNKNEYIPGGLESIVLYWKIHSLYTNLKNEISQTLSKDLQNIYYEKQIIPKGNYSKLFTCFIWWMVDTRKPIHALGVDYMFHLSSMDILYSNKPSATYLEYVTGIKHESASLNIALLRVLDNYFDYMWQQLLDLSNKGVVIDSFNGWKMLKAPVYYVFEMEEMPDCLMIERYD